MTGSEPLSLRTEGPQAGAGGPAGLHLPCSSRISSVMRGTCALLGACRRGSLGRTGFFLWLRAYCVPSTAVLRLRVGKPGTERSCLSGHGEGHFQVPQLAGAELGSDADLPSRPHSLSFPRSHHDPTHQCPSERPGDRRGEPPCLTGQDTAVAGRPGRFPSP